jgi:cytoskeletal protein RodZ
MESVGESLRRARQAQGLDVATVAALTRINPKYLEAIEADDRQRLPSGFFYRSFVHQYATALGLDASEMDAEIDRLLSADAPLPLPGQESAVSKSIPPVRIGRRFQRPRLTSVAALALVVVACSGIYAWWRQARIGKGSVAQQSVLVAEGRKPSVPATTASTRPSRGLQAIPGYKVLLDLIAREETWLSASSDGKKVFAGILAPNQSKTVEGREFARITVGNAAGLEVRLNGRLLEPLGGRGQVLTVVFMPDSFQIYQQPPKQGD